MLKNHQQIQQIAKLAQLYISEAEIEPISSSLNKVLQLVEQIDSADVAHVKPMAHPFDGVQVLREDSVTDSEHQHALMALSANSDGQYYLVPKVIE